MPPGKVIRAVDHPYRRNILHILARGSLTYSQLFASMEPRGGGRGRFNYHLKVLREAGLIQVEDNQYGLSEVGEAAVSFLEGVNKDSNSRTRLSNPRLHVGTLVPFLILGLTSALLLWSSLAPMASMPPNRPLEAGWGVASSIETGDSYTRTDSGAITRDKIRDLAAVAGNSREGFVAWGQTVKTYSDGQLVSQSKIHTARFVPGTGWQAVASYDAPWEGASNKPRIALDEAGSVFALWSSPYVYHGGASAIYASRLIPSIGWIDTTVLDRRESSTIRVGEITAGPPGRAIATWGAGGFDGERYEVYASPHSQRGWEAPVGLGPGEPVYTGPNLPRWVHFAMNVRGDISATWEEYRAEDGVTWLWARIFQEPGGWRPPIPLGTMWPQETQSETLAALVETIGGGWSPLRHDLVVDDRGNAAIVRGPSGWFPEPGPIVWSQYVRGTGWTTPEPVESNASYLCAFKGNRDGKAVLLWNEEGRVVANSFESETGWAGREFVPTNSGGCPNLSVGPTGDAVVVWREGSSIWANYFVRPPTLEDLVGEIRSQLELANARLAGFELRLLLLVGVIGALLASFGIFLSFYWYRKRGFASHAESEEVSDEPPRQGG